MIRRNPWRRRLRIALIVLGTVIAVGGLLALVIVVPPRLIHMRQPNPTGLSATDREKIQAQFESDRTKAENDLRSTVVTMLAGIALATGTVVAALNFGLQRRGQVTERFSRAIDQLGARGKKEPEKLDIRLGGIYALEQIARDSPELHWPIVEILTAFIRENAKKHSGGEPGSEEPDQKVALDVKVATDIQAVLTVLGRRDSSRDRGQLSLGRASLQAANLYGANLQEANLDGANLQGAHLEGANLQGAHLYEANLQGAHLEGANLQGAHLEGANLRGALSGANVRGTDLTLATGLSQQQLDAAFVDPGTKPPPGLTIHL